MTNLKQSKDRSTVNLDRGIQNIEERSTPTIKLVCISGAGVETSPAVQWCRDQQLAALEHLKPGHHCDHPQCCPSNNRQWLADSVMEEVLLCSSPVDIRGFKER